ncbi:MAG TPA: sigma-70 family RNA polymerase sigma factor [Planctomycetota bacterium]|nr:sigma-70 family RNA polymerase sigma factor [Planctomycetota bacterium]
MTTKPDDLQRLLAEEPFVRALAHSLVSDEADDVVQQAFLQALQHRPAGLLQPRSWLGRIVRNLAADQRRRSARRSTRHLAAARRDLVPSSSELLESEERRRALVAAVDRLPVDLRTVVLLRYYDGLPPRRIAAELGLSVKTVWNRLHVAMQTLRSRLDAAHGGQRRAWLLPLVPFATLPRAMPWREVARSPAATTLFGVITMTTKTKIVAAVAAVLALAWITWPKDGRPGTEPGDRVARDAAAAVQGEVLRAARAEPLAAPQREAIAPPLPATDATGALVVHVRYADEPTTAAGLTVLVTRPGGDFRVGVPRAITDAEGTARFPGLAPGRVWARPTPSASVGAKAEIEAGATAECTIELRGGITLTGIVVDATGTPVADAIVESVMVGVSGIDADQVAVTAADGTFVVRESGHLCVVGARAIAFAASQLYFVQSKPGAVEHVRIELLAAAGAVEGVVLGPAGEPVVNAVVRVGEGRTEAINCWKQGAPPLPAQVRTDSAGRFRAIGVRPGTQPVNVRAVNLAPWRGTCEVGAGGTAAMRVVLSAGVTCTGVVRGEDGQVAGNADVGVGDTGDYVLLRTRTAEDGTFTLAGLPIGEFELAAEKDQLGKASTRLHGQPGETLRCELLLSNGLALRGRVVDDLGAPVAEACVVCDAEGNDRWTGVAHTDEAGCFLCPGCPSGRRFSVEVTAREHLLLERRGVDPRAGELELRLARDTAPKARIHGRLLRPDGSAASSGSICASRYRPQLVEYVAVQADGSFAIEVPSGEWHVRVEARNHPEIHLGPQVLESGATWDLGTLQLSIGGTLVVRDVKEPPFRYLVFDAQERFVGGLDTRVPSLRSELLAPGDYLLVAGGNGFAAQAVPFTIRSAQETEIEIERARGVRQRIEFVPAAGTETPRRVEFEIRRDGKLLLWGSAEGSPARALTAEIWLAPGEYSLATRFCHPQSTASFTVGNTEGPLVRVGLR